MKSPVDANVIAQIFTEARTYNKWSDEDIDDGTIRALYDLVKVGPTSANCSPGRFCFVKSPAAKQKLAPALSRANLEKTLQAPLTVIVAHDEAFYEKLPQLFPHADAKSWFTSSPATAHETAFRNGSLQGAYLILAARALGLDTGPMSGFDNKLVDEAFFAGTTIRSNFLVNVGVGNMSGTFPRLPRLAFEEAATIV
ncbi:malonic semialdehyde reductase [Tianweitania sediminis]|uniref:Putative NADH dehydrogenase/NAD(P)H nitroreductase J5Y06_10565 n=1 Tax=Tianweitania sediminis TaxID=1502156 RepID=A0A8J7R1P8_9HYPH|nr:malonic semialdehyde reductase [Tianweitania sediminis]MBP0439093.1 malonic semialdehyde reductase [Tianweitania sediminis]